jgi:hypothetical protein
MASPAPILIEGVCDINIIPWDSSIHTRASPSVIVFTLAVGWYYLVGLFNQGGSIATWALVPFFFVMILAGVQTMVIVKQPQCPPYQVYGLVMAWIVGIVSGAIGYAGASANGISTKSIIIPGKKEGFAEPVGAFKASTTPTTPPTPTQCAVPNDQTFIVDLYKNGKLVSQAITEQSPV